MDTLIEEYRWISMIHLSEFGNKYYNLKQGFQAHWASNEGRVLSMGERLSKSQRGLNWYTDGVSNRRLKEGGEIPEGFVKGKSGQGDSMKKYYEDHPEARVRQGSIVRKRYEEHPEDRVRAGDIVKKRLKENPKYVENFRQRVLGYWSDPNSSLRLRDG
jgi:hypothetical protein